MPRLLGKRQAPFPTRQFDPKNTVLCLQESVSKDAPEVEHLLFLSENTPHPLPSQGQALTLSRKGRGDFGEAMVDDERKIREVMSGLP